MTAEIIPFPAKQKPVSKYTVNGVPVMPPTNGWEYLELCKQFLIIEDYLLILAAILDPKLYDELEDGLKLIVDCFYDLEACAHTR